MSEFLMPLPDRYSDPALLAEHFAQLERNAQDERARRRMAEASHLAEVAKRDSDAAIGEALLAIMNDILDFNKIDAGNLVLELTELRDTWAEVLSEVTQRAEPEPAPAPATVAPLRILVVEDNLVSQQVAQLLLRKLGHQVDVAGDGLAAVHAVDEQQYDVVIMDVRMPTMDGIEATRRIRSQSKEQPHIVALTASELVEDRRACAEAGMEDYLTKPVRARDLQAMLNRATSGARMVSVPAGEPAIGV